MVSNGDYSTPRTCSLCEGFTSRSRDAFWAHIEATHPPCLTCAHPTRQGQTRCERCQRNIEEDLLNRELGQ